MFAMVNGNVMSAESIYTTVERSGAWNRADQADADPVGWNRESHDTKQASNEEAGKEPREKHLRLDTGLVALRQVGACMRCLLGKGARMDDPG